MWFLSLDAWVQALIASLAMYAATALGAACVFLSRRPKEGVPPSYGYDYTILRREIQGLSQILHQNCTRHTGEGGKQERFPPRLPKVRQNATLSLRPPAKDRCYNGRTFKTRREIHMEYSVEGALVCGGAPAARVRRETEVFLEEKVHERRRTHPLFYAFCCGGGALLAVFGLFAGMLLPYSAAAMAVAGRDTMNRPY